MGTVRLAELALGRVEVAVHRPDGSRPLDLSSWLHPGAALLFPGVEARDLACLAPAERPEQLILLDGTWAQVRVLLRRYPELGSLPQVRLDPASPGRYQIRREPRPDFLATVEALLGALRILEPETPGLDGLEQAFLAMVAAQKERAKAGRRRRRRPRTRRPLASLPEALLGSPERLVIAHGEFSYSQEQGLPTGRRVEVLQWCARRLEGEERFEALVRPVEAPPTDAMLGHMALERQALEAGLTRAGFLGSWRAFLRPGDRVAVWSAATARALDEALGGEAQGAALLLKTAYCNLRQRPAGPLEELVAREGLACAPEPFQGRSGRIVGQLLGIARLLVAQAQNWT
jgi:hypothetical protein